MVTALLVLHVAFIVFVMFGAILVRRRPALAWVHLPAAAWGAAVELGGWTCPLTLLENQTRILAGSTPYTEGFIADHLMRMIYPAGLTPALQAGLGALVVAVNFLLYLPLLRRDGQPRSI